MAFYTGKTGSASIGGNTQPLTDWSADFKNESIDVTNFGSSGYQANEAGIFSADITCSGPYDGSIGLKPGASGTFILTSSTDAGAPAYTITGRVTSVKVDVNVRGVAMVTLTATSNGSFSVTV